MKLKPLALITVAAAIAGCGHKGEVSISNVSTAVSFCIVSGKAPEGAYLQLQYWPKGSPDITYSWMERIGPTGEFHLIAIPLLPGTTYHGAVSSAGRFDPPSFTCVTKKEEDNGFRSSGIWWP